MTLLSCYCRHQVRQTSLINFLSFIFEVASCDNLPSLLLQKVFSALPCLIGKNTFNLQHSQISLSGLPELRVALHLLSVNTRSDSPFLNTDVKMERTEEIAGKIVHERVTDLPIHCCRFSFWQKDFGCLFF